MAGHDVTADELEQIHRHAIDAIDYVTKLQSSQAVSTTYDELSVTAELDEYHIVGDIDHLTVTPETYFVTDYKTNQTRWQSPQELAEHYRPQMLCYALALHQHDPERDVHAALRFTDAGFTEEFHWRSNETETVRSELRSMLVHLDT